LTLSMSGAAGPNRFAGGAEPSSRHHHGPRAPRYRHSHIGTSPVFGQHVLVVWDGGREAARGEAAIDTLAKIMNDEKAPHSARLSAAEALLSRGLGAAYPPTVQSTTGRTFEEWRDTLNDEQKRLMEDGIARMENGELDD